MITHDLGVVAEIADDVFVMYAGRVAEEGQVDRIYSAPRHPYTWGLLGSLPRVDVETDRLDADPRAAPVPAQAAARLPLPSALRRT